MNAAALNKDPLPTDVELLRALVRELQSKLKFSELRCEKLDYKLRDLIRRVYGARNEKLNAAQRLLFGIVTEDIDPIDAPRPCVQQGKKAAPKRGGEQLKQKILGSGHIQVDETFTKLLDPERRGRSHDAYLWGYHAPHEKAIVLEFSPTRNGEILYDFFSARWTGIAQTDGAMMYPRVFRHRPGITHIECIAHLRRYLLDAIKSDERQAIPLLRDITELYRIERLARLLGLTHEQRGFLRHARAKPILKRLQRRFRALDHAAPASGNLREAVTYANGRWPHPARYAKIGFGHVHIDQNPIERCFRPGKVGLRNYLFIGHPAAGWRSAVIYTVVSTCRLVGVNPESYLTWVLPQLAAGTNRSTASGLLPHDFARLAESDALTYCAPSPSS